MKKHEPPTVLLDGDELREYISPDLGFSLEDRTAQAHRTIRLVELLQSQVNVVVALQSPTNEIQQSIRDHLPDAYIVWMNTPLEICETRDSKNMYSSNAENIRYFEAPGVHDLEVSGEWDLATLTQKVVWGRLKGTPYSRV